MPNESHSKFVQGLVDAFEDFAEFCGKKWRAAIIAISFLVLIGIIVLSFFYVYTRISKISEYVDTVQTTPENLQEGLVTSVQQSQKIDLELTRVVSGEDAGGGVFAKFHDSKTDLQGKHDFYYSGVNEVLSPENDFSYLPSMVSVPITRMGQFILPMLEKECQVVYTNQIENNDWLRRKFIEEKISILIACPVYDLTGRYLLGFVELVYEDGREAPRDIGHTQSDLYTVAQRISNIISQ